MKKYLLVILLGFCFSISVKAETYYSEYGDFSEYLEEEIQASDTVNVEVIEGYKWYYQDRKDGDYYFEYQNDSNYPYIDYDDYVVEPYSEWSPNVPSNRNGRIVEARTAYIYQDIKQVRYLHFTGIQGSFSALRISEIEIYNNGEKINYDYYCESCINGFDDYINNGIYKENMSSIGNGGYLRIDLNGYYNAESLLIRVALFDVGYDEKKFTLSLTRDASLDRIYFQNSFVYNFTYDYVSSIEFNEYSYYSNSFNIINPEWNEKKWVYYSVNNSPICLVDTETQYRYKDKKYKYYTYENVYSDYLLSENELYPIKSDIHKSFYRYQMRDKVVLSDNFVIDDYADMITGIVESTTVSYDIVGSVDYNKNGIYNVELVFPFITIPYEIVVDIAENKLKEYKIAIGQLEEQLYIKTNTINDCIEEIRRLNELYDNGQLTIIEYQNQIEQMEEVIANHYIELDNLKNELDNALLELNEKDLVISSDEVIINNLKNNINEVNRTLDDLQMVFDMLVEKYEIANGTVNEYANQISTLKSSYNNSLKKIEVLNQTIDELNEIINSKEDEIEKLYLSSKETLQNCENKLFNQGNNIIEKSVLKIPTKLEQTTKLGIFVYLLIIILGLYLIIFKVKKSRMK